MKNKLFLFGLAAVTILLTACNGGSSDPNADVKEFANRFGNYVINHQTDSVCAFYADAEKADSLALSFISDSIKVTETETPGKFVVKYNEAADITLTKSEDGKKTVISSHGLFVYPADALEFARATGQWETGLNDAELADRMADKNFKPWLIKKHIKTSAQKFKVVGSPRVISTTGEFMADMVVTVGVTVQSQSDQPISGTDYKVHFRGVDLRPFGGSFTWSENGKDVPPHGSVTITSQSSPYAEVKSAYVNTTLSEEAHFNKYFKATGGEWKEYRTNTDNASKNE
ncbi:MAG: hypothetical protein IKT00_06890 [Prevotella sp.]|nr:hypothetical protein [Prevotella sp.]